MCSPSPLVSVLVSCVKFFFGLCFFSMKQTINNLPRICPTKMRLSLSYTRDYILIANFVGMAFIPFAILTLLNLKLFQAIKVT